MAGTGPIALHRRAVLMGGAGLAACATPQEPLPIIQDPAVADAPGNDVAFRQMLDRVAADTPSQRLAALRATNPSALTMEGRILYEAVMPGAEAENTLARFGYGAEGVPYAVTWRNGAFRRSGATAADIDADTARLEADAATGVIAPDFILDRTIAALTTARRTAARAVASALDRQIAALTAQRERATSDAGAWRLPNGEAYYEAALTYALGVRISARAAHQRARSACTELQRELGLLLRLQGLESGPADERLRTLLTNPNYLYADSNEGRDHAVVAMNASLERIQRLLGPAFEPGERINAQVRRIPPAEEARGVQGRREGDAYYVDLANIRARPSWTLPSVVHHELIPGHILQAHMSAGAAPPALQLRYASAYSEGWAIYAEQLADELGAFNTDPLGRIGYLHWMLFRAARVVVDTGINALRWDRERAIAELRALQGASIAFVSIEEDVDRFVVQPGQYASQGLAALNIAAARDAIRRRIGGRFSLRRFHDAVLKRGPLSPPGLALAANAAFGL